MITEKELEQVFENTHNGASTPREVVDRSVEKTSRRSHIGYTSQCIMIELSLAKRKGVGSNSYLELTDKGKEYFKTIKP